MYKIQWRPELPNLRNMEVLAMCWWIQISESAGTLAGKFNSCVFTEKNERDQPQFSAACFLCKPNSPQIFQVFIYLWHVRQRLRVHGRVLVEKTNQLVQCIDSSPSPFPPRFFHGVESEPSLDSSLLTIQLAEERKPKPASDGDHQAWDQMIFNIHGVMAMSWKYSRNKIWPPLFWPYADRCLGAGQGVS